MESAVEYQMAPAATAECQSLSGTLRLRLWIESANGVLFGIGRFMLLQAVARRGSLKAAAEELGMSYRAAWGKIKATEEILGVQLIERGKCSRSGYSLSPWGDAFCRQYTQLFHDVEEFALQQASKLPLFDLTSYEDSK